MNANKWLPPELRIFKNFLWLAWKCLGLPEPTRVQYEVADWLQYGPRRRVIAAFRGVGKSYIAVAYILWRLLLDPSEIALVTSASKDRADAFTMFAFQLMTVMPVCRHLIPTEGQRNSRIMFDVAPAPAQGSASVTSRGIFSQITGSRATIILADDVSASNNSDTQLKREKISDSSKEFAAIIKPGGDIIFLGTYQTEEDLLLELPGRGYATRVWPARVPTQQQAALYGERLAPDIVKMVEDPDIEAGTPTDPMRFDDMELREREIEWGRAGFLLHFMLLPYLSDEERFPLRLRDLIVSDVDREVAHEKWVYGSGPEYVWKDIPNVGFNADRYYRPMATIGEPTKYRGIVMAIDPSGKGQDETGYAIVAYLNSQLFVLAAGGLRGGYDDATLMKLAALAAEHKVNEIVIEENFGQGMFESLLKPKLQEVEHRATVTPVRHSKQKEVRIADTLEPVISQHRLIVNRSVITDDYKSIQHYPHDKKLLHSLFYQMSRLTRDKGALKFDDRLDALAMACAHWAEHMALHREKAMAADDQARRDAHLKKWMQSTLRSRWKPKKPSWIQDGR